MEVADGEAVIGFQHAAIAEAILDLIEDGEGGELVIESADTVVDYERRDREGTRTRFVRVKTDSEPHTILSGDLWESLRRWSSLNAPQASFVFYTDGTLYPSAVHAVANRIERFVQGTPTAEDRTVVEIVGIDPDSRALHHVQLKTEAGPASAIWANVQWRIQQLIDLDYRRNSTDNGKDETGGDVATRRLFKRCACIVEQGGIQTITQEEAARIIGVDLADLARLHLQASDSTAVR
jgi:hypothetical protein